MMKLGMPQLYEFDTIEDNLMLAKELNLDFIELNLNFGYCRKEMEAETVGDLLRKYNMEATLHFYDEADLGSYSEVVDAYLKLLERYARLGKNYIKQINIHSIPGPVVTISGVKNYIYEKEYDEYIKRLLTNLKRASAICDKYGINMVVENTDIMPKFMKKVWNDINKEGFKFCYDIGHDALSKGFVLDILKDEYLSFGEFHFHDGTSSKCHLALGDGEIDLKKYKILAEEHNAFVVLEVKRKEDLFSSVPFFNNL
ncbi:MAG: sugar phosphate isomerase/epimerase family protein [Anaeroplasma sp.]